jgi:ribosomal protein S18 acetylase RimI-like enzyme
MLYRPVQEGEKELVTDLILALYQDDPHEQHMTREKISRTFDALARHPDYGSILVFEQENQILGYAILINFWSNEYGGIILTIDELLVLPQYRGQGVGTAFIRHLINSRYHNFAALKLEVLPYNTRALKLYESLGFHIADRHHLVYTP